MPGTIERTHVITLLGTDVAFRCSEQSSVLHALGRVHRATLIVSGCHGGGCGVCRIRVVRGDVQTSTMSRVHVTPADEAGGVVLACRTRPRSDLVIETL